MNNNEEENNEGGSLDSPDIDEANNDSDNNESRREMLAKIGAALALAVVPLEGNAIAEGQTQGRPSGPLAEKMVVRLPPTVRKALGDQFEGKQFQIYFTHPQAAKGQVLAIPVSDTAAMREAAGLMKGATSFTATVKNGLVEIDLARQNATHCTVSVHLELHAA